MAPSRLGGALHCWRDNDTSDLPWVGPNPFGYGPVVAVALIQSNYGSAGVGNLEAVVRVGDSLFHYWRQDQWPFVWWGPAFITSGAAGFPALIQSRFGAQGNFELVSPRIDGGLGHYWRDNDKPGQPWISSAVFGVQLGALTGAALVQSNFGDPGNLELVATTASRSLVHFWRDSGPQFNWNGPHEISLPSLDPPLGA